jgi:nucleoside-diphosphate-sugar epimerase
MCKQIRSTTVIDVFVAGATGNLGRRIVAGLSREQARVRALVRPESGSAEGARALADQGVEIVEGTVATPVDQLARAMDGAEVVISAVQGGQDVIVEGQVQLLRAAETAGVPRLIPSDFAVDLFRLDTGDNVFLDHRRQAHEVFAGSHVRLTSVLCGAFAEVMTAPFLALVDWENATFGYWGDGDQPCDFTTIADAAAYTVAAALDPDAAGRTIRVAGEVLTMKEFHAALEQGSGRRLQRRLLGGVKDLAAEIKRRQATAASPVEYVALQYTWAMVSGKAKLDPLDNDRYPAVHPTAMAQFARRFAG